MATLKRKYSWWSPKNSKWLQENLTDMDARVTVMANLIKEDANYFSRRPKTYHKKRPELLKLVEESYLSYRALAERYDYAIGALHQARKTTLDVYPYQIPFSATADSSSSPDGLHKEGSGLSPSQSRSTGQKRPGQVKRKYSWWSPKNSKWLQDNLTDMDAKVTVMIKLIKEDSNHFSKRPKMYYIKRSDELLKLVEESYRAYLALGERYDYATWALRQAHKTMLEAFPSQISFNNDSPCSGSPAAGGFILPQTTRALLYPDGLQKEVSGLSPAQPGSAGIKRLRQGNYLFGSGGGAEEQAKFAKRKVKKDQNAFDKDNDPKVLSEHKVKQRKQSSKTGLSGQNIKTGFMSEDELVGKVDDVVLKLKQLIAKLQSGNKISLQYQKSLEKVSNMESRELSEQAIKEESDFGTLTHSFSKAGAGVTNCLECLESLSDLETKLSHSQEEAAVLNERASKAENEVQILKQDLTRLEGENEAAVLGYKQCLKKISDLETQLSHSEDESRRHIERTKILDEKNLSCTMSIQNLQAEVLCLKEAEEAGLLNEKVLVERASKAEVEVQILKQDLTRLEDENEALILQNKQCLEKMSNLETQLSHAESEIRRNIERTKVLDEKNLSCTMLIKNLQDEVLCLKEAKEAEVLNEQVSVERAIFAETGVQILKKDLTRLEGENEAAVLQHKQSLEKISELETKLSHADDETRRHNERAKILDEENLSCSILIKNLQEEALFLKEAEENLKEQVELLLGERNAFEQVIYCLKEEINALNVQYHGVVEQVKHVGLRPDSVELSVMSLQQENSKMKELYHEAKEENASLLAKMEQMEKLLENNAHLETSLSDVNAELEELREKLMALEETSKSLHQTKSNLVAEKAALVSQVEIATENLTKLAEKNIFLEESLYDVNTKLEESSTKSKNLEESFHSLKNERLGLVAERDTLVAKLESMRERQEGLEKRCTELGEKHVSLENEKEAIRHEATEVQGLLDQEKKMHANFAQSNEILIGKLVAEKAALLSQVEIATESLTRLAEENAVLENSLNEVNAEFEASKTKSKNLEESFHSLKNERLGLVTERDTLVTQLEIMRERLEGIEKYNAELADLEKEKEALLHEITEVQGLLDQEKKMHASFAQSNEVLMGNLVAEKATLVSQVEIAAESLARLAEKNAFLEKSLDDVNAELEESKNKSKSLEESFQCIKNERLGLVTERDTLVTKLESLRERQEGLEKYSAGVDEKHAYLEKENEALLHEVTEVRGLLDQEKSMHASFAESNEMRIGNLVAEKATLVSQVEIASESLARLAEKNAFLEKSLDDVNAELEESKTKSKSLEESFQCLKNERLGLVTERDALVTKLESMRERQEGLEKYSAEVDEKHVHLEKENEALLHEVTEVRGLLDQQKRMHASFAESNEIRIGNLVAEKATLVSQVDNAAESLARLAEKNLFLEKSLNGVNAELEESSTKSKNLEESFHSLKNERLGLVSERDTLVTMLESMREKLEGLEQCCAELGEKHVYLEKEKETLLHEVTELQGLLDQEKKMHTTFAQSNGILIGNLEDHIRILQEKHRLMENELEKEEDEAMKARLEISIWQICVRNIEEKNYSLLIESQKHLEASKSSEKLITDLEQKTHHQQLNVDTLSNQVDNLKMGIRQVLKLLKIDVDYACPDKTEEDERLVQHILKKIEDVVCELSQLQDDKQQLLSEKLVLVTVFQQLTCDLRNSSLAYRDENSKLLEEIKSLRNDYSNLKEETCMLEEESIYLLEETMFLSNLCLVLKSFGAELKSFGAEKVAELKGLGEGLESLQGINGGLEQEIKMMHEGIKMVEAENLNLKAAVEKLEIELNATRNQKDMERRPVEVCNTDLDDERTAEFVKLKESLCALVGENKEMKSDMTRYAQDMGPLVQSINNLEDLMFSHTSSYSADSQAIKDVAKPQHDGISQLSGDQTLTMAVGIPDLQDLQRRVKAFEKALIEMKRLIQQESMDAKNKTSKAVQVEPKEVEHRDGLIERNSDLEISSGVIIVKDIPLDQVAPSSSYDHRRELYATSLRRSAPIDEQQLESWGIVEKDGTNHMTGNNNPEGTSPVRETDFLQEHNPSTILQEEKEMVVDHVKVPKKVSWAREEGNRQKVLQERLASYNLQLSNLKETVQGLKKKVKKIPKSRRTENSEYDKVEGQLQEVGEAITQLLDSNRKLRKNLEETVPVKLDGQAEVDSRESRNVSVEAQKMCEKIQCLDLEVQKMQMVLMKLDKEHGEGTSSDPARSSSAPARRKRLALRDLLFSDKEKQ